jgi:BsuBI/PstI restriction endonuclease domain/BsuBI/PstI restriction endonuclease HTH domain
MARENKISEALQILGELGMPRAQQNDRSALCLLALLNLGRNRPWGDADNPLMGITPMMDFARDYYGKKYAPNSRETFRRFTMHQLVEAGIALYNPDDPGRPVNSPKAVYQIEPDTLSLLRGFGTAKWNKNLLKYLETRQTLTARYAKEREMRKLPVSLATGETIRLSPGSHSQLIKAIIEEFAPRFVPGGVVIYAGDTGEKWGYFDRVLLTKLGVTVEGHGKMPDVVLHYPARKWLLLVESVTSHGPVDGKRHDELRRIFARSTTGLVYVTAFPSRAVMTRYLAEIAWETEVWCADAPSHLIHFNGARFLGPHT